MSKLTCGNTSSFQKQLRVLIALGAFYLSGCAHTQLRWNTTHQAKTLTDIFEQQVLDNLALFVNDPHSMPSFAYPNQGASDISDMGTLGTDYKWGRSSGANILGLINLENLLKLSGTRTMKEAWTLTPVYDVRRLELMRCAYQQALASAGLFEMNDGCPDCDKLQRAFYLGDVNGKYNDDPAFDSLADWTVQKGRTTPACFESCHWICHGGIKKVPRHLNRKVGHNSGTYVWLNEGCQNELTKLTMVILDYAFSAAGTKTKQTIDVVLYRGPDGKIVKHSDRAIEVKTTVAYDSRYPILTVDELKQQSTELSTTIDNLGINPGTRDKIRDVLQGSRSAADLFSDSQFNDLSTEQINGVKAAVDELNRLKALEGLLMNAGTSDGLPPIQPPPSGMLPLQLDLNLRTLSPSNR
jgi:hypothetical protein